MNLREKREKAHMAAHILIIDNNQVYSSRLRELIQKKGHRATMALNLQTAVRYFQEQDVDVVLMNSAVLQGKYEAFLQQLQKTSPAPEMVIISEKGSAEEAETAIKHGAWDYIVKSGSPQAIITTLSKVISYREKKQHQSKSNKQIEIMTPGIVGNSVRLQSCLATLLQAAQSDANVLITGETGTGKELFATALHENSRRRQGNFVVVDCAALPENLVESTLFGHEKGSFTGATQKQSGLIKQADGGTLFLDEVGELPLSMQKAFLRVLEDRQFRPVGGKSEVKSNFRLVAATNQNLEVMVKQGSFREDLLFRLRTFNLQLPSLRSRLVDITPLVKYFVSQRQKNSPMFNKRISSDFLAAIHKYHWPGNVRELFHAVERALSAAQEHTSLYPYHLPTHIRVEITKASLPRFTDNSAVSLPEEKEGDHKCAPMVIHTIDTGHNLQQVREEVLAKTEEIYLKGLLAATGGDIARSIEISGLSRSRLYQLLKDHRIRPATLAVI